jgi:manganese transport protein
VGVIVVAFACQLVLADVDGKQALHHLFIPGFGGTGSVLLAVGILGATVMPHVVYLHSALTQNRVVGKDQAERRRVQRFERIDVVIAMAIAGAVNLTMLAIFASYFGGTDLSGIPEAFHGLEDLSGHGTALLFGIALLASGLSSSSVGTMAGQVIMQGFIKRRIPLFVRRAVTIAPALVVILIGVDPSRTLVLSQVVLSFCIPFAIVPLVVFTSRKSLMGSLANTRLTIVAASLVAALVVCLNVFLLGATIVG